MIHEWKYEGYNKKLLDENVQNIAAGSEGCIYLALSERVLAFLRREAEKDKNIRYITPFVPEKYVDRLYQCVHSLSEIKELKVTFNDYGFLHMCRDLIDKGKIIPVAGRILTRSIIDCPWNSKLMECENPQVREAVLGHTFIHKSKLDFLSRYNLAEIEINLCQPRFVSELHQMGIKVTGHASDVLISVGRMCYASKWNGFSIEECKDNERCYEKIYIELTRKWSRKTFMYEEAKEDISNWFKGMYVQGNIVFGTQNIFRLENLSEIYDHMII